MKSAIYCEHANESPRYALESGKPVCACPDDCYCRVDGGCSRERVHRAPQDLTVWADGKCVAVCTSPGAASAARRLFGL